jgi:hypothetical protein
MSAETSHSSGRHVARASWLCVLASWVITWTGGVTGFRVWTDLIVLPVLLVGLACALLALLLVRSQGRRGILLPALIGLVLNGLLATVWITNFVRARARAPEGRAEVGVSRSEPIQPPVAWVRPPHSQAPVRHRSQTAIWSTTHTPPTIKAKPGPVRRL